MSDNEIYKVADRVAEILQSNGAKTPMAGMDNGALTLSAPKHSINEKHIDEVVNFMQKEVISQLQTDEEQFVALNKFRNRMIDYWDSQRTSSMDNSDFNNRRAESLAKYIETTAIR